MSAAFITYFSAGVAAYIALSVLFKRAGFPKEARAVVTNLLGFESLIFGFLLWPIVAALILARYRELIARRKRAAERAIVKEREGQYFELSMDALLKAQRRLLGETKDHPVGGKSRMPDRKNI